jgi:4'-phosphopantetheinyl transferase
VRYEALVKHAVRGSPGPLVVVAWTPAVGSERSKLLARRAAGRLGVPAGSLTLARHCPRCGSDEHGRPHFAGRTELAVSLASSDGVTAVAVTRGAPVGVDVEHVAEDRFARIGSVLLHPDEHAAGAAELARTWVRKEALLKALGLGLATDPRTVHLSPATEPPVLLSPLPDGRDRDVWLFDLVFAPLLIGSVALLSSQRPEVTTIEAAPEEPAP